MSIGRLCLAILLVAGILRAEPERQAYPSLLPSVEVERKVQALLSRLTLDEKIDLLAGDGKDGMSTKAIPRVGIPKLVMADGPQGIREHGPACSFPSAIALAATWDKELAFDYGEALGKEARARGIHIQLGPGVNIARTPLSGRNFEYYGEDPYLAGEMAAEWIKGLQSQGVVATVKHFVGNDAEWRRLEIETVMNEQTLREIYLEPFRKAFQQGGSWSVMSAYNKLNGYPSTGNRYLLDGILKEEWRFPGPVMSDWWATQSADALAAGLDLEMPMDYHLTRTSIKKALQEKRLTPERIDDAVTRILRMAISMGFLDREQKRNDLPLDSPESADVARKVAIRSIVLLKNDPSLLPLDRSSLREIVVYGPNAQDTPAVAGGSGGVVPFRKVSFLEGIREALPPGIGLHYVPVPLSPVFSPSRFLDFPKPPRDLPPRITGIRRMVCVTEKRVTSCVSSQEKRILISWDGNTPPDHIPKGREGRVTWDATVEVPDTGEFEIITEGHPEIRLGNKELGTPQSYVVHLNKGDSIPLRVTINEVGRGKGRVSLRIIPVPPEWIGIKPARNADVAIVCAGLNPETEGEGFDRGFALPLEQQRLIRKVAEANPRTIVVLSGGAGVDMRDWIGKVPSVLQTWYLGQEAGTALASILFGEESPSGHLPCTFDRSIDENPAFRHYPGEFASGKEWPVANYAEGIFYGYRGYDLSGRKPLFPFGHGLSFTTFSLSDLKVVPENGAYRADFTLSNTGGRAGAVVAQLYTGLPREKSRRPLRELKGFVRSELKQGESKSLSIVIAGESLRYWDEATHGWIFPEGPVRFDLGLSENDIRLSTTMPRNTPTEDSANPAP